MAKAQPAKPAPKATAGKARVTVLQAFSLTHDGDPVKGKEGETIEVCSTLAIHLEAQKKVKVLAAPAAGEGAGEGESGGDEQP